MRAALLVVDVQTDFLSPALGALGEGFEDRLSGLLTAVRASEADVIHVHSLFAPDGSDWMPRYLRRGWIPCVRGTSGAEVVPAARPAAGELVVEKQTFDAFLGTDLQAAHRCRWD
jgi:nicotinamidase-related amidase